MLIQQPDFKIKESRFQKWQWQQLDPDANLRKSCCSLLTYSQCFHSKDSYFFLYFILMVLSISPSPAIAKPLTLKVQLLSCCGDCAHKILPSCWLCPRRLIFVRSFNRQMENQFVCFFVWVVVGWDKTLHFWDYKLNARDYFLMGGSLHFLIVGGCWGLSASHTFHPFRSVKGLVWLELVLLAMNSFQLWLWDCDSPVQL